MARSDIRTLTPLDYWAWHYGLNMYRFNQVNVPIPSDAESGCDPLWCQYAPGYGPQGRYHLRDALAQALAEAEARMARYLGSPVAPDWVQDEVEWPAADNGLVETLRFRVIEFGRPQWTLLGDYGDYPVVYIGDWGYVTIPPADYTGDMCLLRLVSPGYYGDCQRITYEIRPVSWYRDDAGNTIAKAHKAQFVRPALWEDCVELEDVDETYLDTAEVWIVRAGVGETYAPAVIICPTNSCAEMCVETTEVSCAVNGVLDRQGGRARAYVWPASYVGGKWVPSSSACSCSPSRVRLYYRAGVRALDDPNCCMPYDRAMADAVARLATAYLSHQPCGCEAVAQQFMLDRALMRTGEPMSSPRDPVAYQNTFGDSWAAQNALHVVRQVRPNAVLFGGRT